jgi:hypothetical protein
VNGFGGLDAACVEFNNIHINNSSTWIHSNKKFNSTVMLVIGIQVLMSRRLTKNLAEDFCAVQNNAHIVKVLEAICLFSMTN